MRRSISSRSAPWIAAMALAALLGLRFASVLTHLGSDFVDFHALHGDRLVFERADTRLNAWILAWVERAAFSAAGTLFDGNIHHPEPGVLTGSEHLLGVALQLLPFEPLVDGAVARHQLALVLSSALLMASSFVVVRWATGSLWAAALGAGFALGMPWRVTEISHLQLLSVQWLPLVWLGVLRGLRGETGPRALAVFGAALSLQLLSSFYLAYFATLSCAAIALVASVQDRPRTRDVLRLAAAAFPGFALLLASALPYLARRADAALDPLYDPAFSISPGAVWEMLAPRWAWSFALPNEPATYWTPWAVLLLGAIALADAFRAGASSRPRQLALGLAAVVGLALLMMLGGSIEVAGAHIPTPARLLAALLPGFDLLRGPTRWGILAATALPLLAGLGAHALDERTGRKLAVRAAVLLGSAASFGWFALPTAPAWPQSDVIAQRYEALRSLPPGPLLELPWPSDAGDIEFGSRSVLSSTLHWRPILNGYTGHRPRSYRFLQRISTRLPSGRSIDQLRRLTGVRHVLIDLQQTRGPQRARWSAAEASGRARLVHDSLHTRIYELPALEPTGDLIGPLIDRRPRPRTFNGLARDALALETPAGELESETASGHEAAGLAVARLRILNTSDRTWPGFDVDPEGLVRLRYTWFPIDPAVGVDRTLGNETRLAALYVDLPPGLPTPAQAELRVPRRSGRYELCVDLVQQVRGDVRRLPVPAVRRPVVVRGDHADSELARLIDAHFLRPAPPPACGTGT